VRPFSIGRTPKQIPQGESEGGGTYMTVGEGLRKKIENMVSGRILFDEPMCNHTSMGVGGKVDILLYPRSVKEIEKAVSLFVAEDTPFLAVGSCTNLIVGDGGYRGCLISLMELQRLEINEGTDGRFSLYAESGVPLSRIVEATIKESLEGMEFCAGIPGSVGGGVWMNAGAYGREVRDAIGSVVVVNGNGKRRKIEREELHFEYRGLDLPDSTVIAGATFDLVKGEGKEIQRKVFNILNARRKKHPLGQRSAGSVFKNPPDSPAGRIIDELGLKGTESGGAMISEMHGNFIVNLGGATTADILALIDIIRKRVFEAKGITLETEVKIIGELL
jgi:UDP-N-acetylmuramate dehydrogenase